MTCCSWLMQIATLLTSSPLLLLLSLSCSLSMHFETITPMSGKFFEELFMLSHFNNKQLLRGYSERPQPELSHLNESQQKDGNLLLWPFTGLISNLATVDHNWLRWGCMGNNLHLQIQTRTAVLIFRALIIVRETHNNATYPHWIFCVDEGLNLSAYHMKHIFGVFLWLWC